jgi:hypothetical protein
MNELSTTVLQSTLWLTTLSDAVTRPHAAERERLRTSFIGFRQRAALLASEIGKDLPGLTVHDISHLDALWEVASQIVGADYSLTPTEGYVLGGAILLHDLAMSLAATPGGYQALKGDLRWKDLVFSAYSDQMGITPGPEKIAEPDESIRRIVVFNLLRLLHAENAEKLAFLSFQSNSTTTQFLIEDTELRQTFGRVIGQIAHSHWWSIEDVERNFDRTIGAPHWAHPDWTINPLKLACILRAADAAHIDARRAPTFQKAFAHIDQASLPHWVFQERLNKSYLSDDALVYTSGLAFSLDDASAWWLCLDTLRMIDRELRSVDGLLSDRALPRFAAKRVAGVDAPERLATYVRTTDWHPINATIQISDLPNIIRSLGGEELYGKRPRIPLRELLQNASDAIRARRYHDGRPHEFGQIKVSVKTELGAHILCVEDNGVGMSKRVLTDFLLDFGNSFWNKPQVQEEFPGLLSSGFRATGRYGIGFFSVFMAADRVTVITRRPDAASKDTLVLEFGAGLTGRPILRPATNTEQLRDGGTVVRLQLKVPPTQKGGLFYTRSDASPLTLRDACRLIAPALDTQVSTCTDDQSSIACQPNDWITASGEELLSRLEDSRQYREHSKDDIENFSKLAAANLRFIKNDEGLTVARACVIAAGINSYRLNLPEAGGAVTVGGFTTSPLQGIAGVFIGDTTTAARDKAKHSVAEKALAAWADEQATLVTSLYSDSEALTSAAEVIRLCGGHTGPLPIALRSGQWLSFEQISNSQLPDEIVVVDHYVRYTELKHTPDFVADSCVFYTGASGQSVVFQSSYESTEYSHSSRFTERGTPKSLLGAVLEAVANGWGIDIASLLDRTNLEREIDVRIGTDGAGREIRTGAIVIRRIEP